MSARDIGLFLQSARTDARLGRLRAQLGAAAALEAVYAGSADPWASASPRYRYQRRKYEVLASLLPNRRFAHALDLGCGLGLLSRHLAPLAERVLGVDIAPSALAQAAHCTADLPGVSYECHDLTALPESLDRRFDLVAVADVLYYLDPLDEHAMAARIARLLAPGGVLLLANHYFFRADPDSRRTRRIHQAFEASPALRVTARHRRAFYLATLFGAT